MRILFDSLPKNSPYSVVAGVTHDLERIVPIWWLDYWCRNQLLFQRIKRFSALFIQHKRHIFLQKLAKRLSYFRKILNKAPVKTCMTKKRANLPHTCGVRQ